MTPIPMEEREPEENQRVIGWVVQLQDWAFVEFRGWDGGGFYIGGLPLWVNPHITHWFPLPPNPHQPA